MSGRRMRVSGRSRKRIDLIVMAVAGLALAGCGASAASPPTTNPTLAASTFTSQSASAIVAQAVKAMTDAGSVNASGGGTVKIPNRGNVTATEVGVAGGTSGSQVLKASSDSPGSPVILSATTLDVDGNVYSNDDATFWTNDVGATGPQAVALAGKWVQIPSSSPLYANAAADVTLPTLVRDLFHATTYHKGSVQSVDGVPAIKITYTNSGGDNGPATTYVAVGGKHLPVSVDIGGLSLHMTSWGKVVAVSPPPGAVPLASVLATVPSGSTTT
jgi:hypothetical protein